MAKKYLDYNGLLYFWGKLKVKFARHDDSIEYINGTQTAATGSWTGVTKDSSLYTGKTIAYRLPYAGSGNASLNLTLAGGTTTGAKAVYSMTTRVTTHYPAGSVIHMTYDGSNWRTTGWYNTNNYDRLLHNNYILCKTAITANKISAGASDGYFNLAASTAFDMTYPLVLPTGAVAANAQFTAYESYPSVNPNTTATVQGAAVNKMVFLKGTISGTTFTTASSNWITCTVPTSADGFYYMPLGRMSNDATTKMFFNPSNTLFAYINGAFRKVEPAASKNLLEQVYPVGSIYINASNSTNPGTLLGFGTWSRVGQGRVMIDADSTYGAGSTGGSATHTHTTGDCTLTSAQSGVPAHGHGNTIKATTPKFVHSITQPAFKTPVLAHTVSTQPEFNTPALSHSITQPAFKTPVLAHTITQPAFNTPELTHSVTQPAFNTPSLSHSSITQPVFKYTAPASHTHLEHYRIGREASSKYIHIAAFGSTSPSTAVSQKTSRDAITDQTITNTNQKIWEDGQMVFEAAYVSEGHSTSSYAQYDHIYPCQTSSATGAGTANGTTASRTTNVAVGAHAAAACTRATDAAVAKHSAAACSRATDVAISDHAATACSRTTNVGVGQHAAAACSREADTAISDHAAAACSRTTNVGVGDHAATDCTMSGSVSNNTAANASSAHNHGSTGSGSTVQPWVGVYMWKRTA